MRIICVYKTGRDYDHRYVVALRHATEKFLGYKHSFTCLTNSPDLGGKVQQGIKIEPMQYDWPGWWSKLELFRPTLNYAGTTIYFDLDVLIRSNISEFVDICLKNVRLMMLRSADSIGEARNWPSSSIMSWKGSAMNHVWKEWIKDPEKHMRQAMLRVKIAGQRTDQGFIRQYINPLFFQDQLPKKYLAFKLHYFQDPELFDTVKILNWTGKPRFHEMENLPNFWEIYSLWNTRHENIIKLTNQV